MRVLRHARRLCRPEGTILDLTSVHPPASIEHDGVELGQLEQTAFLARAAITEDAVDALVTAGLLVAEASVVVDVLKHFDSGADAIEDIDRRAVTRLPDALRAKLRRIGGPVAERSHCLLRRLRVE